MSISIREIDHLVLRVVDVKRMMDWYGRVLGCQPVRIREDLGLYQLRAGSAMLDLVPVDGKLGSAGGAAPGKEGRNLDHFCLRIEPWDGDAILAELDGLEVAHGPVEQRFGAEGDGPSIYCTDPEGNTVELKGPPSAA